MKTHIYLKPIIGLFVILSLFAVTACKHDNAKVDLEPTDYTVTFDTDGGTQIDSQSVTAGEVVEKPETPEKTGFEFDGWYTDNELTAAYDFTTEVTSDFTLYAKWKIIVLDVTFFTDGGSEIETQKINYNEKAAKPAKDPTKDNCTFDGWYTDKIFTTAFDFTTPITQNITIYAKWLVDEDSFEVKFETSGGTDIATQVLKENEKATKPDVDPTREHSKFDGWYADEGCSVAFDFNTELTEATTIYAKWIPVYTVTFNTNGGTTVTAQEVESGKKLKESEISTTLTEYKFAGWYEDSQFTTAFDFDSEITQNTTLYAKWIALFTITFIGADVESQTVEAGQKAVKPQDPVSSKGYLFGGWYSDDAFNNPFDFNTPIRENRKIYAKWIDSWTVTFSGASEIPAQSVKNNAKATRPSNPADQNNLKFDNWYADSAFTTLFDFDTPITENTTIYAKWLTLHTVTFDSVGGTSVTSVKVLHGSSFTKPADPTREHRTFAGWFLDSSYINEFIFGTTTISKDTTLYAKWKTEVQVDNPVSIQVIKAQLEVEYTTGILMYGLRLTFTSKDGEGDWYIDGVKASTGADYTFDSNHMYDQSKICTVEFRKMYGQVEYVWTALVRI